MPAISIEHLTVLKEVLDNRYVGLLPDLIANQNISEEDKRTKQISRALSAFAIQKTFNTSAQDAAISVVDNYNDNGLDAIYYDERSKCLALVQAKLHERQDFTQSDAQDFVAGINLLLKQEFETFNQNIQDRLTEIELALDNCDKIKLIVICTGNQISQHAKTRLDALCNAAEKEDERLDSEVIYIESEHISHFLLEEQSITSVNAKLKIIKPQKNDSVRPMVHGHIALKDLVELHNEHPKALYEKNIRYYLGANKSDVNSAIKKTLNENPQHFIYLNNGITALCNIIKEKSRHSRRYTHEAKGLSIVNGAQTIASAAEFLEEHPDKNIDAAKVMFTLIQAPEQGTFHKEITKARNFQNTVNISNFVSLDNNQEKLRKNLMLHGYKYYYRPETTNQSRGPNSITIDEVIIALLCLENNPKHAIWLKSDQSRYKNQDSNLYKAIFTEDISAYKVINAHICYKAIKLLITDYEQNSSNEEKKLYKHGAYAISFIFMKRLLSLIEGKKILDAASIAGLISGPLDTLRQTMQDEFEGAERGGHGALGLFGNMTFGLPVIVDVIEKQAELSVDNQVIAERKKSVLIQGSNTEEHYQNIDLINFIVKKTQQIEEN